MPAAKTEAKKRAPRRKKAAADILHVAFVWDMSGSMDQVLLDAIEGFNQYVADLQSDEDADTTLFSLTIFDTVFEHWYTDVPVKDVPRIGTDRYIPRGGTALYDAIANTISEVDKKINGSSEEKVLVVILTDGFENSSQEYHVYKDGRARLAALVEKYKAKGNWTFVYLGANDPNVVATASSIGVPVGATAAYTPDSASIAVASAGIGTLTSTLKRSAQTSSSTPFADAGIGQDFRTTDAPVNASVTVPPANPNATSPAPKPKKPESTTGTNVLEKSDLSDFLGS